MLALSLSDKGCCFGIFVFVFNRFLFSRFSFVLVFITIFIFVFVNENHTGWVMSYEFVANFIRFTAVQKF